MLLSLLQGSISEISKLFLKDKLKTWWEYNKIDRDITRKIRDTCEDEGVNFDAFLDRLGITESNLKKNLKELKKSFKASKTFTSTQEFLDTMSSKYLELLNNSENPAIRDNPLTNDENRLIKKMKANIQAYLTNLKPVETIASINIKLGLIEEQNKEHYDEIILKLDKISSQVDLNPNDLNDLQILVEGEFESIQHKLDVMSKDIKVIKNGAKVIDSKMVNEYVDVKIGFKDVEFSEDRIKVGEHYQIKIRVDAQIPFQVTTLGFNVEPVDVLINDKRVLSNSKEHDFYIFHLPEVINCSVGKNLIAIVNLKGPKPNFKYELYITLEGQVKQDDMKYLIKKSKGPFQIERVSGIDFLGNLALNLIDKFVDPNFSKKIKKLDEEGKERYF